MISLITIKTRTKPWPKTKGKSSRETSFYPRHTAMRSLAFPRTIISQLLTRRQRPCSRRRSLNCLSLHSRITTVGLMLISRSNNSKLTHNSHFKDQRIFPLHRTSTAWYPLDNLALTRSSMLTSNGHKATAYVIMVVFKPRSRTPLELTSSANSQLPVLWTNLTTQATQVQWQTQVCTRSLQR